MPHNSIQDWLSYLLTAVGGGGGVKLLDWLNARRKMRLYSDVALQAVIDNRVKMILEEDEKTISRLTKEVSDADARISAMEVYIGELVDALRSANIAIPKRPDLIRPN